MTAPPKRKSSQPRASRNLALIAYCLVHGSKGKQPVYIPVGGAIAHPDGEGYTLGLDLLPAGNGQIILRKPKANSDANAPVLPGGKTAQ